MICMFCSDSSLMKLVTCSDTAQRTVHCPGNTSGHGFNLHTVQVSTVKQNKQLHVVEAGPTLPMLVLSRAASTSSRMKKGAGRKLRQTSVQSLIKQDESETSSQFFMLKSKTNRLSSTIKQLQQLLFL